MNVVKGKVRSYNKDIPVYLQYYFPLTLLLYSFFTLQITYFDFYCVCSEIQFPIISRAAGEIVSSIFEYSDGDPVLAVWNKWLRPGSSLTV